MQRERALDLEQEDKGFATTGIYQGGFRHLSTSLRLHFFHLQNAFLSGLQVGLMSDRNEKSL